MKAKYGPWWNCRAVIRCPKGPTFGRFVDTCGSGSFGNTEFGFELTDEEIRQLISQAEEMNRTLNPLFEVDVTQVMPILKLGGQATFHLLPHSALSGSTPWTHRTLKSK